MTGDALGPGDVVDGEGNQQGAGGGAGDTGPGTETCVIGDTDSWWRASMFMAAARKRVSSCVEAAAAKPTTASRPGTSLSR